jgi:CheY-like chemotaxis protein
MNTRFLIADRDPVVREDCRRCLSKRGHEVDVAANGLQCIDRLRMSCPTVLVLDPDIPWGGGDGVLEWLSREEPLNPLVVVLTNGHSQVHLPDRLLKLVTARLERPRALCELSDFVNRLEDTVTHVAAPAEHFSSLAVERSFS